MSTLAEKAQWFEVARELYPCCARCGRNLAGLPLASLRVFAERPNRFVCPEPCADPPTPSSHVRSLNDSER